MSKVDPAVSRAIQSIYSRYVCLKLAEDLFEYTEDFDDEQLRQFLILLTLIASNPGGPLYQELVKLSPPQETM